MSTEKRPINMDDLYQYALVEDPQISPDGQWIAFVRAQADKFSNSYKRNIWLQAVDGGDALQLTRSGKDSSPRWSPDGATLAFSSSREGKPQIYLLPMLAPGGEARTLTNITNGATGFAWSPDGAQIAFLSAMNAEEREKEDSDEEITPPQDELEGKHRKERREQDEKLRLDPYPMEKIPYRAGTSFVGDRTTQIYVMPTADGLEKDDAKPRRLTHVDVNHEAPVWSADGKNLYTGRTFDEGADEPFRRSAIYRITVADGELVKLTDETHASFSPQPSPDGNWIAFIRYPHRDSMSEHITRLAVVSADGGDVRDLNIALDQSALGFSWTADSSAIVFNGWTRGTGPIHKVTVDGSEMDIVAEGDFKSIQLDQHENGDIAFTASTYNTLTELFWLPAGSNEATQMSHFNQKFIDEVIVQEHHELVFTSPDGNEVQGWYMLPVGYEEGQKYPLALNIHGGPHQMWGPSEPSMFHEWQLHAASGYVVFYCNPRGSDGYGEAFMKALHAAWGEVAYKDVMAGVDTLLEKGFVDESRMAVTGGSYGGYMTAWIIGQTDRFVSAVSQRGVYNLISFYGTSDIPSLISGEFDVEPWEDHEFLWKHSPVAYAQNIKTPLLLIHSENDFRVPIEQAEQLFAFVRRSGGTVKMLRFPRDGHELSRSGEPHHRVSRLTHMVDWFDTYCKS